MGLLSLAVGIVAPSSGSETMVQADYGTTTHGATLGIDVDSTTVKAVLRRDGETLFADYRRHYADARSELARLLDDIAERFPTLRVKAAITGSGGLAVSQILEVPFVQEVIAGTQATRTFYPQADVVIEVGGVFAKSDLQPLINQGAAHEDLAASIFQSVATQTVAGLANGRPIRGTALFLGGPLHFLPELRAAYERILSGADDSRNCPIVATYPEALRNNMGASCRRRLSLSHLSPRSPTASCCPSAWRRSSLPTA